MAEVAIIGGSGLTTLANLETTNREVMRTPYGEPSAPLIRGQLADTNVVFIPRHGENHTIPPHKVNYRANLWTLRESGAHVVVAVAAVGGIRRDMRPGRLAFPDQLIDYTCCREHTFFDTDLSEVIHIDFTAPYSDQVRQRLIKVARQLELEAVEDGTYGATQGPRLETAAEVDRLESDGCTMVGMTGMPEAALARELGLCYASCAVVANWAAGRAEEMIRMEEIERNLVTGMAKVRRLLETAIPTLKDVSCLRQQDADST